jgi:predicted nucleic acid-binding Zn ribbon protein
LKKVQEILPSVYREVVSDPIADEDLVLSYWPSTVGPMIACRTHPLGVFGDKLFVEVTDSSWLSELRALRWRITRQLNEAVGRRVLSDVTFRLGRAHGKPPARAARASGSGAGGDEADEIRDPNLRRIFRAHRKAAGKTSGS